MVVAGDVGSALANVAAQANTTTQRIFLRNLICTLVLSWVPPPGGMGHGFF